MKWLNHLLDIIYPKSCEGCKEALLGGENLICTKCLIELPRTNSHIYPIEEIEKKFWGKIRVANTITYMKFSKKGIVQSLLHALKYRDKPELGTYLGELYGKELKEVNFDKKIDLIIGIPLNQEKEKQRGYNQANFIAEGLSKALNVPFDTDATQRVINTSTQTKKGRMERFNNVNEAFEIIDNAMIRNKRIAIVDDVLTTGATIESFGKALLESGCSEISVITMATAY